MLPGQSRAHVPTYLLYGFSHSGPLFPGPSHPRTRSQMTRDSQFSPEPILSLFLPTETTVEGLRSGVPCLCRLAEPPRLVVRCRAARRPTLSGAGRNYLYNDHCLFWLHHTSNFLLISMFENPLPQPHNWIAGFLSERDRSLFPYSVPISWFSTLKERICPLVSWVPPSPARPRHRKRHMPFSPATTSCRGPLFSDHTWEPLLL